MHGTTVVTRSWEDRLESHSFSRAGLEREWDGTEGADDLVVHSETIAVKTRTSNEYRSPIKCSIENAVRR
jgi:hypothetical protein